MKTEFSKFGGVLDKVQKQLGTASRTIEKAGVRTRQMQRKLKDVETLPMYEANQILELAPVEIDNDIAEVDEQEELPLKTGQRQIDNPE